MARHTYKSLKAGIGIEALYEEVAQVIWKMSADIVKTSPRLYSADVGWNLMLALSSRDARGPLLSALANIEQVLEAQGIHPPGCAPQD